MTSSVAVILNEEGGNPTQRRREMKLKLRKGSKYFVANPDDVRFGKRIRLACHYRGLHPEGHLFTFVGDFNSGYWLTDKLVAKLVEPYSEERDEEFCKTAEYYLEHGRLPRSAR
jgi:hypothetical protein